MLDGSIVRSPHPASLDSATSQPLGVMLGRFWFAHLLRRFAKSSSHRRRLLCSATSVACLMSLRLIRLARQLRQPHTPSPVMPSDLAGSPQKASPSSAAKSFGIADLAFPNLPTDSATPNLLARQIREPPDGRRQPALRAGPTRPLALWAI